MGRCHRQGVAPSSAAARATLGKRWARRVTHVRIVWHLLFEGANRCFTAAPEGEKVSGMQATLERLRQRREERGDEGGFTLIELLIVIVILGILAAIVVFAVQNLTSQSAKASCGSDYKTVETAMETYKAQVGHY